MVQELGGPLQVFVRDGVDISNSATLGPELLKGVSQIVSTVGPVFGRTAEGQMGCGI